MTNNTTKMEYLRCNKLGFCQRCSLAKTGRRKIVFGSGSHEPEIMVVGGSPDQSSDILGDPFVGRTGALLNKLLMHGGTRREKVYLTNLTKCRPPEDRVASADEVRRCSPFLHAQIAVLKPKVIVALGPEAGNYILDNHPHLHMKVLEEGSWEYKNAKTGLTIPVVCISHPEWLLRQVRPIEGKIASAGKRYYNEAVSLMKKAVAMSRTSEDELPTDIF